MMWIVVVQTEVEADTAEQAVEHVNEGEVVMIATSPKPNPTTTK